MYKKNRIQPKYSKSTSSFSDNLTIENTLTFENVENSKSTISAKSLISSNNTDYVVSLVKSDKYSTQELIDNLSKDKSIMYVEENYPIKAASITNDTYEKYQWAIENIGQNNGTKGADINPEKVTNQSSKEKVIAIIDSGIDYNHPELKNSIWNNPYSKSGLLLGEHGYDFYNSDLDPMDDYGHGTHVAGIIAAEANNNSGITGAMLNRTDIKIMALKIFEANDKSDAFSAISAYHYIYKAQQLGINVVAVNISWGNENSNTDILKTAIDLVGKGPNSDGKGALSICASGNESSNNDAYSDFPSCIDSDYIISVAASNEKDELATFSNYGTNTVDIAAPGTAILSTVSYNCFNPSIYENKSELCSTYESFDSSINNFKYKISAGTVTTTKDQYFGNSGKSLQWEIDAKSGNYYYLSIPYLANNKKQHISEMLKIQSTSGTADNEDYILYYDTNSYDNISINYKNYIDCCYSIDKKDIINKGPSNYNHWKHIKITNRTEGSLVLVYYPSKDGKFIVNIDDFAVSKSEISEEQFGKYDFYNGTSMATPYVTAAVGISSDYYENETALARKNRVLGSVRKVDSLSKTVKTSGVLDLSKLVKPTLAINSINIDKNGTLTIGVINLSKNTKLLINDKEVPYTTVDSKTIKITNKNLINKTTKITLKENEENVVSRNLYLIAGKQYNYETDISDNISINKTFTDGSNIYCYSRINKAVYKLNIAENNYIYSEKIVELSETSYKQLLGEQYTLAAGSITAEFADFTIINNIIYALFKFDYGYTSDMVLAYYDMLCKDNTWKKFTALPAGYNLSMPTFASYNSKVYLIGGYNETTNTISKKMYELDLTTKKWITKPDIPEERFGAKSIQVGNKLLLAFGGKEDGKIPNILIYDGNSWKKSSDLLNILPDSELSYNNKKYFSPEIGLVSGGIVISGITAEKYGNTFFYNIDKDSFENSGYVLNDFANISGISLKNKYYVFLDKKYTLSSAISVYTIPIKSGLTTLTIKYPESHVEPDITNGNIYSVTAFDNNIAQEVYYYMPGQPFSINLGVSKGYYIKNFKVDGKEINSYKYNGIITANKTVEVKADKNTNLIKLNKTTANLSSFNTLKLTATINNKSASKVTWKSSNTKYATVSSTGKITPTWEGNGKTVTITASTKIKGKTVSATSKITIKKPTLTGLKVSKKSNSSVTLEWNKVTGCDGYKIYKYNTSTKKYVLYKTLKTNSITISKLSSGTDYKFKVFAYKTINKKIHTIDGVAITAVTLPTTPTLSKLSSSKKILTVKWAKVTGATGYEIYVSQSKTGKYVKKATINKQSTTSQNINGLTKGKTYYVKVRAYKTVGKNTVYSNYSTIKSIKIK